MFDKLDYFADSYIEESFRNTSESSVLNLWHPVILASVAANSFAEVFPTTSETTEIDVTELFESFINQLGKEDWCFAGTTGELAYRLLYAVTASILEVGEQLPEEPYLRPRVLAVFKGIPIFGNRIRNVPRDYDPTHTEISFPSSGRFNASWPRGISVVISSSHSFKNSVWIAPDGSSAGYGEPPDDAPRLLVQIPLSIYPNAAKILSSLVFLTKEEDSQAYSLSLYEDLKFGSFSPLASKTLLTAPLMIDSFISALFTGTPSGVFDAIVDDKQYPIPTAPRFEGLDLPSFVIAEIEEDSETYLWWGFTNKLGPGVTCAIPFSPLIAWLAFGPPHHYLAPFPPQTAVKLESVFRFWNGPKELEPEVMHSTSDPSEQAAWLLGDYVSLLSK